MHLIVGLGNPGPEYADTRHNLGFRVVDALAKRGDIAVTRREHKAVSGRGVLRQAEVMLAKPQTFMNASGEAVARILFYYRTPIAHLIVVCDDLDLPLGKIRVRREGSAGGHKGLKSVIEWLHTSEFKRVRLGIGSPPPGEDAVEYVLSPFRDDELPAVAECASRAADAIECILTAGIDKAMNEFN